MIRGSLLDGIQEALSQFNRLLQATKQNNVSPHAVAAGNNKADMDVQCMHVHSNMLMYMYLVNVHDMSGCFDYLLSLLPLSLPVSLSVSLSVSLCLKAQSTSAISCCPSQIEIIILTSQQSHSARQSLERIVEQLDLENLKKIQIVSVSDPERPDKDHHELGASPQSSTCSPDELSRLCVCVCMYLYL